MMLAMLVSFALMNATFISAQALGTAANAILLQNSAPLWMFFVSVLWLGEKADLRGVVSLILVAIGLVSGATYAGVILGLRILRDLAPAWLTVWNHLLGSLVLLPLVLM